MQTELQASPPLPKWGTFLDSFTVDDNSSYITEEKVNDINFTLRLSNNHKPNRNKTRQEQPQYLKDKLRGVKKRIIENLISNIIEIRITQAHFIATGQD